MTASVLSSVSEPIQSPLPVCLPSWRENPYRLVNLLEIMKAFRARDLLYMSRDLRNRADLIFGRNDLPLGQRMLMVQKFRSALAGFMELCNDLELPMSSLHASQLFESTESATQVIHDEEATRLCGMLSVTVENELSLRQYFGISPEKSKFYSDGVEPFGTAVADAFPSISFDANEASRCFALGRNTACVFHLMRVMELGLSALGKSFGVPCDHTNWETIINRIEKAIGEMDKNPGRLPSWKDDREFYSQCASHFRVVKNAWRNYTAHARGKYDEQEALDMLGNVRGFMQKLATRLQE